MSRHVFPFLTIRISLPFDFSMPSMALHLTMPSASQLFLVKALTSAIKPRRQGGLADLAM